MTSDVQERRSGTPSAEPVRSGWGQAGPGPAFGVSVDMLLQVLERVADAVALVSVGAPPEDRIAVLHVNAVFASRTGIDSTAGFQAGLDGLGHAFGNPKAVQMVRQSLLRRESFQLTAVLSPRDRPSLQVDIEGWPVSTEPDGCRVFAIILRDVTVQANESRLRNAVESISDGFCLVEPGGRIAMVNRRFNAMYPELQPYCYPGADSQSVMRKALELRLIPEAVGREEAWIAERLNQGAPDSEPYEFQVRDGSWYRLRGSLTDDGWLVSIRTDITREKENERQLRASERRFRALAESAPAGVFQADRNGDLTYANPKLCALAGRTVDEMLGRGWRTCIHQDDLPHVVVGTLGLIRSGHPQERTEFEARVNDRWVSVLATPDRDADGRIVGIIGMATDIHERREMEAALRYSEQRYRKIIETAHEGILLNDRQGIIRFSNRRLAEIVGMTPEAMMGRSMFDFLDPDAKQVIASRFATRAQGIPEQYEFRLLRADGIERWILVSSTPMLDSNGAFDGALAMFIDITQRHEANARLAAYVSELEQSRHQLQELAARYEKEKLRAEESNRAKTRFLSAVSHELRTPLNSILGFSDILRNPDADSARESDRSYADDIYQAGSYLLELINDILDMSKIEAGKYELRVAPVALGKVLQDSIQMLRRHAADQQLDLRLEIAPDLPQRIRCDGRAVRQVLLNLLSNAIKFTPKGGEVILRAGHDATSLRLCVSDTGIGIPAEDIPRLGVPFEQLDNALNRRHQGTGLGLALSRALIELHGGTLTITSTPGVGTRVTVLLPLEEGR
jgi:PAS domain S-box-containing protein